MSDEQENTQEDAPATEGTPEPSSKRDDYNFIPTTYQELWDHYFAAKNGRPPIARTLLRQILKHGTDEEFQTLLHETFLRMQTHDILTKYDKTKSNFGGMVFVCARTVATSYLGKKSRDPLGLLYGGTLTDESSDPDVFVRGTYHLDRMNRGRQNEPYETLEAKELLQKLALMVDVKAKNAKNLRDASLPKLLDLLYQELSPKEIAVELGVTQSTVTNWIKLLGEMARSPYDIYVQR